ncbi:MAG: hypothetical protein ABSF48_11155 [Thermodesulfobacteriota bacterium]|jgi:Flp pilus assembly protein TadD
MISAAMGAEELFSVMAQQPSRMESLAKVALSSGINFFQDGNYDRAVLEFRRAIGLSPESEDTVKSYDSRTNWPQPIFSWGRPMRP